MEFKSHQDLETPHGNTTIWRYMGLDKFLDLLTHQRLFFTNAKSFTDGYEISLPPNLIKRAKNELIARGYSGRDLEEELALFEYNSRPMRELTLVNCWSIGRHESYALWKIYLGGANAGVAIKTNISKLKKSISRTKNNFQEDIYIGQVKYTNYLPDENPSRFKLVTTKRQFYEYENELRLFILKFPLSEGGVKTPYDINIGRHINVDLETMVNKIYLSPFAGSWFRDTIEQTVQKVVPNLSGKIESSLIIDQ